MSNWYPLKICQTYRGKLSYPVSARIPMLLSGENFGDKNSPQVSYLRSLQSWDHHFPGFEHETEGTEIIDGIYHVMCVKA